MIQSSLVYSFRLSSDLVVLLYHNGYPPEWNDEVFARVLDQVENFKRNED